MQLVSSWVMKRLGKAMKLVKTQLPFHFYQRYYHFILYHRNFPLHAIPRSMTGYDRRGYDRRGYEQCKNTLRMNTNSDLGTKVHQEGI